MREQISAALKEALNSEDATRISTLRLVLAALKDREIAARDEDGAEVLDEEQRVIAVLDKMIRQREDSVDLYEEGGRLELADRERDEIDVIRSFLPRPLSKEETAAAVDEALRRTEAHSIRDIGRVMAFLKEHYAGRMDFKEANARIRAALA